VARRELHAEGGEDAIEALVLEGERLGVALHPVDGDAVALGPPARGLEQLGRQVRGRRPARRRRGPATAMLPGARRDVEHVEARRDLRVGRDRAAAPRRSSRRTAA
jgi:hypothetical protein